ncbi:MAG TPA: hypothetical protein VLC47_03840 [Burkholderiales bacterium]|nr:hypothetical protein [Burkholderiales bacterium]
MLELLLLLGALAYLIAKWSVHDAGATHVPVRPQRDPDPPAPLGVLQRLTIADTQRPQLASAAFVRAFGLDPRDVRDIRMYARGGPLETFPAALTTLLFELHREGCVVGAETAALLFRGRPLQDGEALYFALTTARPMPRVVAFLDKQP